MTWVMISWNHDDEVNVDVHVDSDWAKGAEKKSTTGKDDDHQRHSGGTLFQNASDACAEHGGSRALRGRHGCSRRIWNAVNDGKTWA